MKSDRGDDGAVGDPDWSARIELMSHQDVDKYIGDHALAGPLNAAQVTALLQHLPPPPAGWGAYPNVLADYTGVIDRWKSDVKNGTVPSTPTPNELAAWCDHMHFDLPTSFVVQLKEVDLKPARQQQSVVPIAYPDWVPLGQPSGAAKPKMRGRGRPKTSQLDNDNLLRVAKELLLKVARDGRLLTIDQLAKQLKVRREFVHWAAATIARRLNGKLPWAQARAMAERARN